MTIKEKILLVQLLLLDIRGNWGWEQYGNAPLSRARMAKDLCEEIAYDINDNDYLALADSCSEYIEHCYDGYGDGRWFRDQFPMGYEGMDELHGLAFTYKDKSDEFKSIAEAYLTYPENRFDDWEDRLN
jgi:hypothetical protein